jgi:hypothetical protein
VLPFYSAAATEVSDRPRKMRAAEAALPGRARDGSGAPLPAPPGLWRWGVVRFGVGLTFCGLLGFGLLTALLLAGTYVDFDYRSRHIDLLILFAGACALVCFVGVCLCCSIPAEWAEWKLAVGLFVWPPLLGLSVVAACFIGGLELGTPVLLFGLWLYPCLTFRSAARHCGDELLGRGFLVYPFVCVAVVALAFLLSLLVPAHRTGDAWRLSFVFCTWGICGVALYAWALWLLARLWRRIPGRAPTGRAWGRQD